MTGKHEASEAAIARRMAAQAAMNGSDGLRSGRIDVPYFDEKRIAKRLLIEAQSAYRAWAYWQSIDQIFVSSPNALEAANWLRISFQPIQAALAHDALLGAFRITDAYNQGQDRVTLCRFALLLDEPANQHLFASRQWAIDQGHSPATADYAAARNDERVKRIVALIVPDWRQPAPSDREMLELRTRLKTIRDNFMAHAIDSEQINHPTLEQIGRFIHLTLDLAFDTAMIFIGSAEDPEHFREFSRNQADRLWMWALKAPEATYKQQRVAELGFSEDSES